MKVKNNPELDHYQADKLAVMVSRAEFLIDTPSDQELINYCTHTLKHMVKQGSIDIRLCSSNEIRELNYRYRNQDKPTNVLSFQADIHPDVPTTHLGDIVACVEVINHEASEQKKPSHHHWAHMMTHAVLHLLGYDHVNDQQAAEMETLEYTILARLSIPNPYQSR